MEYNFSLCIEYLPITQFEHPSLLTLEACNLCTYLRRKCRGGLVLFVVGCSITYSWHLNGNVELNLIMQPLAIQ